MKWYRKIVYIAIYAVGFILIGATSLISSDLGWKGFQDWSFYVDTGLTYTAIICIIIATLLKIVDDFKRNDPEYKEAEKDIKDFATKRYVPSIFSKYSDHVNYKRKLKQYIHNIKRKIYELESKASDEDIAIWVGTDKEKQKTNAYCIKRTILEKQLTDDYIKKNINTTKVVYDKISASVILGGYYDKDENKYVNEFITKHKSLKAAKENLPRLLFGFAMTCFATSIVVSLSFNTSMILPILTKLITLLFQAFMTVKYANEWNETVTIKDMRFRKGIVKEYDNWTKQEYERQQKEKIEGNKKDQKSIINSIENESLPEEIKELKAEIEKQSLKEV